MKITADLLLNKLNEFAHNRAPVRSVIDKKGRPRPRAVGKKGTNMYSPYPGNLNDNGIVRTSKGVKFDYDKVGYIGYANIRHISRNSLKIRWMIFAISVSALVGGF